ncbi:hypothetical protein ACFRCW_42335 [Streptomyces sp. NPDC056653]|uniref:hypothetical protein n=1 Tax=Streptomyces sp. NPDC056653 TaxID=3345894 RepID=UPI00367620DC
MTHAEREWQWLNGDGVMIELATFSGAPLMRHTLEQLTDLSRVADTGEVIRFSYQPTPDYDNPDAPTPPRRYARLVVEQLPAPDGAQR